MPSAHRATIGRKLWYWSPSTEAQGVTNLDDGQAFDASVVFVHENGNVNVTFYDHIGVIQADTDVVVHDPEEKDQHNIADEAYCTWMPYQKQHMDAQTTEKK